MGDLSLYNRSGEFQLVSSMPQDFDIVEAGDSVTGQYTAIQIFWATVCTLPNDTTSILKNGVGVNLSVFSNKIPKGTIIRGHFTSITSPDTGHDTILLCYKAG